MSAGENRYKLLKQVISGGVGGMCLVFVGQPFDTIKVRIQTMEVVKGQEPPYRGVWDCAMKTMRKEGPFALYKGMSAPLVGVTPMYMLCFLGYGIGQRIFTTPDMYQRLSFTDLFWIGMAGATSGLFTTPILAPGERLKCYLQVQGAKGGQQFKGPMDLAKHIYKTGGMRSLNRGFFATMARDSLASMFYFSTYEVLKRSLIKKENTTTQNVLGTLFSGGMAGVFNWLACLPIDTLKSKLQTAPDDKYKHGIRSVFIEVMKTDGFLSLYRGFGAVMIRAFPANAACFLGVETAMKFLDKLF